MALADPLLVCRELLLSDPVVSPLVGDAVYATPDLPQGHTYPCIRLTHIATTGHAPVAFRHSAAATVQLDVWAETMPSLMEIAEGSLDALHGVSPIDGANYIRPTSEGRSIDESVQPPMYRYRADLEVRVVREPIT